MTRSQLELLRRELRHARAAGEGAAADAADGVDYDDRTSSWLGRGPTASWADE